MSRDVYVGGVGMTRFGRQPHETLKTLTVASVGEALRDARVQIGQVEAAFFANAIGGSITGQEMVAGQVSLRAAGFAGIPIYNVENACASASSALQLGAQAVAAGTYEVVLVVGSEKMTHPDKRRSFAAIAGAAEVDVVFGPEGPEASDRSYFIDMYASLAREYLNLYEATVEDFAAVVVKNQRHGASNERAQYGGATSIADVLAARQVVSPLTVPMCSPISDGSAAVVLVSEDLALRLEDQRVRIAASVVASGSAPGDHGGNAVRRASATAYEIAGVGPNELDLVELHDATASAEVKLYEDIGLCPEGGGGRFVRSGRSTYGGSVVVNPSGGLLAKGHPIGATGVAQVVEAVEQLSGRAGNRQVPNARWALTQNAGGWLDGDSAAVAVTILEGER